jgi:hypothetical protein
MATALMLAQLTIVPNFRISFFGSLAIIPKDVTILSCAVLRVNAGRRLPKAS